MQFHGLVCTILFLGLITLGHCQRRRPTPRPYPEYSGRVKRFLYTGPIKNVLDKDRNSREAIKSILSHFNNVGLEMQRRSNTGYATTGLRQICDVIDDTIKPFRIQQRLRMFGIVGMESKCITDLKLGKVDTMVRDIKTIINSLDKRRSEILSISELGWEDAKFFSKCMYKGIAQTCEVYHLPALRVNSTWSLLTSMTPWAKNINAPDRTRPYLEELITWSERGLRNVLLSTNKNVQNATSIEAMWSGSPSNTVFAAHSKLETASGNNLDENPAVKAALFLSSSFREQVHWSLSAANISIMIISCVLAFVPLSCFHAVKLKALFFYVLLTDVLSCAPLAIKGFEMIYFTNRQYTAIRTRIYGLDKQQDMGVAEVWASVCSAPNNVYNLGIKFIMFAFFSMTLGIVLEVIMLIRLRKRREEEKLARPFERWWQSNAVCAVCFCGHSVTYECRRGAYSSRGLLFRIPSHKLGVL